MWIELTKAPRDWEILQHKDRKADIALEGTYTLPEDITEQEATIYAGVVDETDWSAVVDWKVAGRGNGNFSVTLHGVPAGGLYRIEMRLCKNIHVPPINGIQCCAVHHIGVGDNYVIAGQSNASGTGKGEIEEPLDLMVHVLRDRCRWDLATQPFDFVRDRHSPWLAFGHTMARRLGYPVGLIPTAVAGSLLSSWLPEEKGELYREMMETVKDKIGVGGILWVQGCSEAMMGQGDTYLPRLLSFIRQTRNELRQPDLPILLLQINRRMDGEGTSRIHRAWAQVREAQRKATHLLPSVYLTTAFDARLSDGIHHGAMTDPALGQRIAQLALYRMYGIGTCHDAPEIQSATKAESGTVILRFSNTLTMQLFAVGSRIPLTLCDECGEVPLARVDAQDEFVYLRPARKTVGKMTVSAYDKEESPYFFCDSQTNIPAMAFYEFPVE